MSKASKSEVDLTKAGAFWTIRVATDYDISVNRQVTISFIEQDIIWIGNNRSVRYA